MRAYFRFVIALLFPLAALAGDCAAQDQDELGVKLAAIDGLRQGTRTPLELIEKECTILLNQYTKPEEQGRIYYQLAHSYAQSGMSRNDNGKKAIDYAEKALHCPLEPALRLHLYVYWGDAIMLSDLARPRHLRRAEAAPVYLKGLKEAQQFDIPAVAPERPPFSMPTATDEEGFRREKERRYQEAQRIEKVRMLHLGRSVLEEQLIFIYTRRPYAASEFRKLAREVLGDAPVVTTLTAALEAKGALQDDPLPQAK